MRLDALGITAHREFAESLIALLVLAIASKENAFAVADIDSPLRNWSGWGSSAPLPSLGDAVDRC